MPCSEDQTALCSSCADVQHLETELAHLQILLAVFSWPWPEHLLGSATR
jgi:hypothetical protein